MNNFSVPLDVQGVSKVYPSKNGPVHVLRDLSFQIRSGRSMSLVGESGCGKTTAAYCISGLERVDSGVVYLSGQNFSGASRDEQKRLRRDFGMVFQNPLSALNPRLRIWQNVAEPLRVHEAGLSAKARQDRVREMLERMGLGPRHFEAFPAELSGGQLQRVVLARALVLNPKLVILDEPTSALDVSIQAQVLNLLQELQDKLGLSYLFITHNLALVEILTDDVMVMYSGRVVESGPAREVFAKPRHPYTKELIASIPALRRRSPRESEIGTVAMAGQSPGAGCPFRLRCPRALPACGETVPGLDESSHAVACLNPIE